MQSTPSLSSLPSPLWSRVIAPDRVLSMGQIELNVYFYETELLEIELFWHLTVCGQKLYLYLTELFDKTE